MAISVPPPPPINVILDFPVNKNIHKTSNLTGFVRVFQPVICNGPARVVRILVFTVYCTCSTVFFNVYD